MPARPRDARLLLAALSLSFAACTLLWLRLDRAPPSWDDAWYLTNTLVMFDALVKGGIPGYAAQFLGILGFKAPLITVLPTPFYLLLGRHWHAAFLVNIAAMALLFAGLYGLGRRWWSERAGLIAVAVAGTMPLLYGLSRWFLVDYALTAAVVCAVWLLAVSDGLKRDRLVLAFGAVCGLGLLLKIGFALFVFLPFAYVWLRSAHRGRVLVLAGLPCLILALPWYLRNARATVAFGFTAGYGALAQVYGTGDVFSWHAIAAYLRNLANSGISPYFVAFAVVVLAAGRPRIPPLLFLWMLPFLLFLFGTNKDIRLTAPILPAVALLIAGALDRLNLNSRLRYTLLVYPILAMLAVSFGFPWRASRLAYARTPERREWPLEETLRTIALHAGNRPLVLVATDGATFNANNLELTVTATELPLRVESTAHENDLRTVLEKLDQASFVISREGGEPESPIINPHAGEVLQRLRGEGRFAELPFSRPLPDGGTVRIFRRTGGVFLPAGASASPEFSVNLGGMLELTALSSLVADDRITVKYRWRCIHTPDRDYWCFTHVLDSQGKAIGFLDHKFLGGDPPLRAWQPGDAAIEEMVFRVPPGTDARTLRLKLGVYDPVSGDRLAAGPLDLPAAARFTVADGGTAVQVR